MNPIVRPLDEVVGWARAVLLGFDGPTCDLFAGHSAATVTVELHALIRAGLGGTLPPSITIAAGHPIETLRAVALLANGSLTQKVAQALRTAELVAAGSAKPCPGALDLLQAAQQTRRPVIIISDHAAEAVNAYLNAHNLTPYVRYVSARTFGTDPRLLTPNPHLVRQGIDKGKTYASESIYIAATSTEITAGRDSLTSTIAYTPGPSTAPTLLAAGPDTTTPSMTALAAALRRTPAPRS